MNNEPLAVVLYGANIRRPYPCGCESSVNEQCIFTHYTNPNCEFDKNKIGRVSCNHHYVPFDAKIGTLLIK